MKAKDAPSAPLEALDQVRHRAAAIAKTEKSRKHDIQVRQAPGNVQRGSLHSLPCTACGRVCVRAVVRPGASLPGSKHAWSCLPGRVPRLSRATRTLRAFSSIQLGSTARQRSVTLSVCLGASQNHRTPGPDRCPGTVAVALGRAGDLLLVRSSRCGISINNCCSRAACVRDRRRPEVRGRGSEGLRSAPAVEARA